MTMEGRAVRLQVWDTAGNEGLRTMSSDHYNASDGAIIVSHTRIHAHSVCVCVCPESRTRRCLM